MSDLADLPLFAAAKRNRIVAEVRPFPLRRQRPLVIRLVRAWFSQPDGPDKVERYRRLRFVPLERKLRGLGLSDEVVAREIGELKRSVVQEIKAMGGSGASGGTAA